MALHDVLLYIRLCHSNDQMLSMLSSCRHCSQCNVVSIVDNVSIQAKRELGMHLLCMHGWPVWYMERPPVVACTFVLLMTRLFHRMPANISTAQQALDLLFLPTVASGTLVQLTCVILHEGQLILCPPEYTVAKQAIYRHTVKHGASNSQYHICLPYRSPTDKHHSTGSMLLADLLTKVCCVLAVSMSASVWQLPEATKLQRPEAVGSRPPQLARPQLQHQAQH